MFTGLSSGSQPYFNEKTIIKTRDFSYKNRAKIEVYPVYFCFIKSK